MSSIAPSSSISIVSILGDIFPTLWDRLLVAANGGLLISTDAIWLELQQQPDDLLRRLRE